MVKLNWHYTVSLIGKGSFEVARFNLIWRFNYVLSVLFILLNIVYLIQGDWESVAHFTVALLITSGSLIFLYKTKNFRTVYFFIAISGILFTAFTLNTVYHLVHYGDIVWIIVAVSIAYFGLGASIGKYFAFAGLISIAVHIGFFINRNISEIIPLTTIDKIALISELTIAISIVFYIIYQYTRLYSVSEKNIMNANAELTHQNNLIQKQNAEKEVLLKEIHHRVKNNLQTISSLLNLQSYSIKDDAAVAAIHEGQGRIKTMALLHQKLYSQSADISKIDFGQYAAELIDAIEKTYKTKNVSVKINIHIKNIFFDIDTAIPLGLILNELCTNAYKYALTGGGILTILINKNTDGEYELSVHDSGNGLGENFNQENINSLGLKLVNILSRQLRGKFVYSYENGAKFVISFLDTEQRMKIV